MSLVLKQFDAGSLRSTQQSWKNDLTSTANVFAPDVVSKLEYVSSHSDYAKDGDATLAYGIFEEKGHVAAAIVTVSISKEGRKWVKMLDCYLRPSLQEKVFAGELDALNQVIGVYAAAVAGVSKLVGQHNADVLKVYGRSRDLLTLLTNLGNQINTEEGSAIVAAFEGRWLVVKQKRKGK